MSELYDHTGQLPAGVNQIRNTTSQPEVITNDDPNAALCTIGGVEHDYRPHTYRGGTYGRLHTSLRCVWCHVVACGDYGESDPCIEPYHHHGDHRTRGGVTWPKGGNRPPGGA